MRCDDVSKLIYRQAAVGQSGNGQAHAEEAARGSALRLAADSSVIGTAFIFIASRKRGSMFPTLVFPITAIFGTL